MVESVEFQVLGLSRSWVGPASNPWAGHQQRLVLALLIVFADQVVVEMSTA
jgi:hypothetical protein